MEQWVDRLSAFLGLPMKAIGRIGGGKKKPTGTLDVALIQSLVRKGVVDDVVGEYGHLVVDECHRLSAPSFEQVARRAKAKFVTGLSATVTRKDGRHPIILHAVRTGSISRGCKETGISAPFAHSRCSSDRLLSYAAGRIRPRSQFRQLYEDWLRMHREIDSSATMSFKQYATWLAPCPDGTNETT
jgi:hypothetical protein